MLSTLVQRVNTAHLARAGFFHGFVGHLGNARLHAIDAAFLDTILNYELIIYTTWRDRAQLLLEIRHAPND